MRAIRPSALLATFLVLPVLGFALLACGANPLIPARPTPSVSRSAVLFKAPEAVIALAADGEENVYALTAGGTLLRVTPDGKSQELASNLQSCSFSFPALAALPDGSLVTNECVDKKDTLVRIDRTGSKTTLRQLDQHVMAIAADAAGTVYLGAWTSEGNLTVIFEPTTYLAGAEQLDGQILALGQDGQLTTLYQGGVPQAIAVGSKGELYAAFWGQGGAFGAESKSYSMCGSAKHFWIVLSEQVQVQQLAPEQQLIGSDLAAVSYIGAGGNRLLAFGSPAEGRCGIYQVQAGQEPRRVVFSDEHITDNLTVLAASERNLYFGDIEGNVYRVGWSDLAVASAAAAPAEPAVPSPTAPPRPPMTPLPTATPFVPEPSSTPAETLFSLAEAVNQGLVDLRILGTGAASGNSIVLEVTRRLDYPARIQIDRGTVLANSAGSEQDMVVRRLLGWRVGPQRYLPADSFTLAELGTSLQDLAVEAYCLSFHEDNPSATATLSLGGPAPAGVLAVLDAVDRLPGTTPDVAAIQVAIWAVTDDVTAPEVAQRGYGPDPEVVRSLLQQAGLDPACYRYFGGSCYSPTPTASAGATPGALAGGAISPENAAQVTQVGHLDSELAQDLAWSPDGRWLAIASFHVMLYDAQTRGLVSALGDAGMFGRVAFSPDGQMLAAASMEGGTYVWELAGGGQVLALPNTGPLASVAFSPDGSALAVGSVEGVTVWAIAGGQVLYTIPSTTQVAGVAFSPDGRLLAAGVATDVKLWDAANGHELRTLSGNGDVVLSVAFSPDGQVLAAGSTAGTIHLWDVASGIVLRACTGHTGAVNGVAFSPGGRLLASASADLTVRLWDVASGRELRALSGHSGEVRSVDFSPDGATLASGAMDARAQLWGLPR